MKSESLKQVMEVVKVVKSFIVLLLKGVLFFFVNEVFFRSLYQHLRHAGVLPFTR